MQSSQGKQNSSIPAVAEVVEAVFGFDQLTRTELIAEIKKLRGGIRQHRDRSGHDLCWHQLTLWGLLPEKTDPMPAVPEWSKFLEGCLNYRRSLDEQALNVSRTNETYDG